MLPTSTRVIQSVAFDLWEDHVGAGTAPSQTRLTDDR
jgi:hypothetical protein